MNKIPKLTDKEVIKWAGIIGHYRMKELYISGKIDLTTEQVAMLIKIGREIDYEGIKNTSNK